MPTSPPAPANHASTTTPEETALLARSRQGDRTAFAELIHRNLRLAYHFARSPEANGVPADEAVSLALVALMQAVEHYDPARGRLSSLVALYFRGQVSEYRSVFYRPVRVPLHKAAIFGKISRAAATFPDRAAPVSTLARTAGVRVEHVHEWAGIQGGSISLDYTEDGLRDALLTEVAEEEPDTADAGERRALLDLALSRLPALQREVIRGRFGLNESGESETCAALSLRLGLSKARIGHLELAGLKALRCALGAAPDQVQTSSIAQEIRALLVA